MSTVAARDLRNHTADVLRRVATGDTVTVTVRGEPVAELTPVAPVRPAFFTRADLARRLRTVQADAALRTELARLAGDTTDDLDAR